MAIVSFLYTSYLFFWISQVVEIVYQYCHHNIVLNIGKEYKSMLKLQEI